MNDREFWIQMRRGLIILIDAIDQRFALNHVRRSDTTPLPTLGATPSNDRAASAPVQSSRERAD